MKEKNIKLIMEMIFIFILPLMFILPSIKITDNYVYDNSGNFESSDKIISYDSIVYNSFYKNYLDFNQYVYNGIPSSIDGYSSILPEFSNVNYNDDYIVSNIVSLGSANWQYGILYNLNYFNVFNFILNHKYLIVVDFVSSDFTGFVVESGGSNSVIVDNNGLNYLFTETLEIFNNSLLIYPRGNVSIDFSYSINNLMLIDLTKMFGEGYEPSTIEELNTYVDLSIYHEYSDSEEIIYLSDEPIAKNNYFVKSVVANLKELISNVLLIDNNNVVFNLVVDYCGLWLIMFVVWHLLYAILDFIVHLCKIRKRE